jgi:hypothetical protein
MSYVTENSTGNLVIIDGATIEFVYEAGTLSTIRVHQPMRFGAASVDAVQRTIAEHCSEKSVLIEEPARMKGTVHIREWKVINE